MQFAKFILNTLNNLLNQASSFRNNLIMHLNKKINIQLQMYTNEKKCASKLNNVFYISFHKCLIMWKTNFHLNQLKKITGFKLIKF